MREKRSRELDASLVFVGAGVLSTARIMLESLGYYDEPLEIRHSDHFTLPGGGYHSGGDFPMSAIPHFPQTDPLGRLPQLEHIHLIDASVLPSIPAVPTAVIVMANAHRIASLCQVP